VEFVKARVTGIRKTDTKVVAAVLDSGAEVSAESFVNAAGAWSGEVGMYEPRHPRATDL